MQRRQHEAESGRQDVDPAPLDRRPARHRHRGGARPRRAIGRSPPAAKRSLARRAQGTGTASSRRLAAAGPLSRCAEPMLDHRREHRLHVLGNDGVAAGDQRPGARRAQQADGRARRQARRSIRRRCGCGRPAPARSRAAPARRGSSSTLCCSSRSASTLAIAPSDLTSSRRSTPLSSSRSAAAAGYPRCTRIRNRSSCDSGSGKVPTCSCGFCVAMTKNGSGSGIDLPVERHLPLLHGLEQRALRLGRGAVDFIGEHQLRRRSGRAESGICRVSRSKMDTPSTSAGSRSLVN